MDGINAGRHGRRAAQGRGLALCGALLVACQGSVQADARGAGEAAPKSFDRPIAPADATASAPQDDAPAGEHALLGARHDLAFAGPRTPACACLAVVLSDRADDPAFVWQLEPPRLDLASQQLIALSSADVPCDAPPTGTLGASYQGYAADGDDIVVYVEALGEGRPMTSGAIIPKPKASGAVFVEPTNAVYGKPLDGKGKRCRLAAPGARSP